MTVASLIGTKFFISSNIFSSQSLVSNNERSKLAYNFYCQWVSYHHQLTNFYPTSSVAEVVELALSRFLWRMNLTITLLPTLNLTVFLYSKCVEIAIIQIVFLSQRIGIHSSLYPHVKQAFTIQFAFSWCDSLYPSCLCDKNCIDVRPFLYDSWVSLYSMAHFARFFITATVRECSCLGDNTLSLFRPLRIRIDYSRFYFRFLFTLEDVTDQ